MKNIEKMPSEDYYAGIRWDVLRMVEDLNFSRILEIGGGDFKTLKNITEKCSAEGWGVDQRAIKDESLKIITGSIECDEVIDLLPEDYFDLVMANDVLEHLADSDKFFNTVYEKLSNKGLLLISVPNIRQLRALYHIFWRGTFPRQSSGLFDATHLRWFSKLDVINIARTNGFELEGTKSVGRFVPNGLNKTKIAEFFALQNIFLFKKIIINE
jgi:SAM-dependent methyltransferase